MKKRLIFFWFLLLIDPSQVAAHSSIGDFIRIVQRAHQSSIIRLRPLNAPAALPELKPIVNAPQEVGAILGDAFLAAPYPTRRDPSISSPWGFLSGPAPEVESHLFNLEREVNGLFESLPVKDKPWAVTSEGSGIKARLAYGFDNDRGFFNNRICLVDIDNQNEKFPRVQREFLLQRDDILSWRLRRLSQKWSAPVAYVPNAFSRVGLTEWFTQYPAGTAKLFVLSTLKRGGFLYKVDMDVVLRGMPFIREAGWAAKLALDVLPRFARR
ncbi:MAG: hypothetical protein HY401_08255 [Elusimicrobia bacterium]|nr:hypothetical protein [Elusimicrobiota bacterium]